MNVNRREIIRSYVNDKDFISIKELQELCPEVSFMTLHRDLDVLEEEGVLTKVRGGAKILHYTTEPLFDIRSRVNIRGKQIIAEKVLSIIKPGISIFLDAGTTNLFLSKIIPDVDLNIFTTSPSIALELCRLINPSINLCGGNLNRANLAVSGQSTLDDIEKINIDVAFLGASGCVADVGFVCGKESEMLVKQKILKKARKKIVLCDSSKIGRLLPFTFASFKDIDILVTDKSLPENIINIAQSTNTEII